MISSVLPRLEHVGIAVDEPGPVRQLYKQLLGTLPYKLEVVEEQGVATHFISAGATKLELLEATEDDSPIARHIARRGEGLHHLAFEVEDLRAQMRRLEEAGFRLLSDEPRPGADGKQIVFLHPKDTHGVLVEFCEEQPPQLEPEMIPVDGGEIAAYKWGQQDRPRLTLLHGAAGATVAETAALARLLAPYFHIVALDYAGHGASTSFNEHPLTGELFVQNAVDVLNHLGHKPTHLFGFSMGGYIAMELARHYPDYVEHLAVYAGNAFWDEELVDRMLARLQPDNLPDVTRHRLNAIRDDWQQLFRRMQSFVRGLPDLPDVAKRLGEITQPTLITSADNDDLFPLQSALDLHAHIPHSRLAVLPATRHEMSHAVLPLLANLLHVHYLPKA